MSNVQVRIIIIFYLRKLTLRHGKCKLYDLLLEFNRLICIKIYF